MHLDASLLEMSGFQSNLCYTVSLTFVDAKGAVNQEPSSRHALLQRAAAQAPRPLSVTHHDGEQSSNHRKWCSLTQDDFGQHHTEDWLQGLHSVRQTDGHCCKGQVSGHVTNGVHGGRPGNGLELLLGDGLQASGRF